jgi:hypothetical protein
MICLLTPVYRGISKNGSAKACGRRCMIAISSARRYSGSHPSQGRGCRGNTPTPPSIQMKFAIFERETKVDFVASLHIFDSEKPIASPIPLHYRVNLRVAPQLLASRVWARDLQR